MEDLPDGYTKIEGFHGCGRDIYLAKHRHGLYQIMSKNLGDRQWFPGKCFEHLAQASGEFKAMTIELKEAGFAVQPLVVLQNVPGFGRF